MAGFQDLGANGMEVLAFLPRDIIVREGDTITWKVPPLQQHTVTFLSGLDRPEVNVSLGDGRLAYNPVAALPTGGPEYEATGIVGSGVVNLEPNDDPEPTYSLTFAKAGTYEYVCLIHPVMTGSVSVIGAEAPSFYGRDPFGQDVWDTIAEGEKQSILDEVEALDFGRPRVTTNPDGSDDHGILAGISTERADLLYFYQPSTTVSTGDTVTWSWERTATSHTVSFVPKEIDPPELVFREAPETGPAILVVNPAVLQPSGADVFVEDVFFSSGLRNNPALAPPGSPGHYTLVFTQPGTYEYICLRHWRQGMRGTIIVTGEPAPVSVASPLVGDFAPTAWMGMLAAILGVGLVAGGVLLIRRYLNTVEH
jgi:plastocyanin